MNLSAIKAMRPGDRVKWNDPDAGACSKVIVLTCTPYVVSPEMVRLHSNDGGFLECPPRELELLHQNLARNRFGLDPVVGMGCTYAIGSDEYACTIFAVRRNGREVDIRMDKRVQGIKEVQRFLPNPKAELRTFTLRQHGSFREKGRDVGVLSLGERREYRDPDF